MNAPVLMITDYTSRYRRAVLDIMRSETRVHHHLDWRPIRDWLTDEPETIFLALNEKKLLGVIAFSPPHRNQSWLRLIGIKNGQPDELFHNLLQHAISHLAAQEVRIINILEMQDWLYEPLTVAGFHQLDHLVHLERKAMSLAEDVELDVDIRRVHRHDLPIIQSIDNIAFAIPWQMRMVDFRAAYNYASHFTAAVINGQIVAYQLSTSYPDGMHLARLATLPQWQGRGLGKKLVVELIEQFPRRSLSVNTQASNTSSRRVYETLGFEQKPYTTPIWSLTLPPSPFPQ